LPVEVFVDTSAWYPIVDRSHPDHPRMADLLVNRVRGGDTLVTTNLVLAEAHALVMRRIEGRVARAFLAGARAAPNVVVHSTAELEVVAEARWLTHFQDQDFSLTDAVSFAVMAERGMAGALTLDRHFAAAGFVPLM
jgi:predicted nucleic acid-binding protein